MSWIVLIVEKLCFRLIIRIILRMSVWLSLLYVGKWTIHQMVWGVPSLWCFTDFITRYVKLWFKISLQLMSQILVILNSNVSTLWSHNLQHAMLRFWSILSCNVLLCRRWREKTGIVLETILTWVSWVWQYFQFLFAAWIFRLLKSYHIAE
jgi:hypothetical protein